MKNTHFAFIILLAIFLTSCEKEIYVPLNTAPPKLVIDASIKWKKGTLGNKQQIKLSTTFDYYSNIVPKISGATIFVKDSNNNTFNFEETDTLGNYNCNNFIPVLNQEYTLTVQHENQVYTASETLKPVPVIDKIEQKNDSGFTADVIQVKAFYTDNGATSDFYLFKFQASDKTIPSYQVYKDEFYQGNQIFGIYEDKNLKTDQDLNIAILGISERYYNYLSILISIAGNTSGAPFQSPPATVRGNIVNTTNEKNYPLGYFNLSEMDFRKYTIK
ncbi:MAG: DUF4249 domain-containing protein [Flavobacterium sp.]|nr:DUF4249 domain-containing protein [Flavobacterium sp.]